MELEVNPMLKLSLSDNMKNDPGFYKLTHTHTHRGHLPENCPKVPRHGANVENVVDFYQDLLPSLSHA